MRTIAGILTLTTSRVANADVLEHLPESIMDRLDDERRPVDGELVLGCVGLVRGRDRMSCVAPAIHQAKTVHGRGDWTSTNLMARRT